MPPFDGLTNFELQDIAHKNNIKLDLVIMMDELLTLKKQNYNLILNLQDTGVGNGTHWICLITRGNNALYIDSFGGFAHPTVIKWCLYNDLHLGFSNYICQSLKSQRCGYYSLQAIKQIQDATAQNLYDKGNAYVNLYEPSRKANEKIVMQKLIP